MGTTYNSYGTTSFMKVYDSFLSKITDDMYMELTPQDTVNILQTLLVNAIPFFEFPRQSLNYELDNTTGSVEIINQNGEKENIECTVGEFVDSELTPEEINILATYMVVSWLDIQLASIENVRLQYSGADFKFTSQANHMQKIDILKKDFIAVGLHLQRLYKRRKANSKGIYKSTFGILADEQVPAYHYGKYHND